MRAVRWCLLAAALLAATARAEVQVTDASGQRVHLAQPAKRIVSLAPHVTELLYAAGAGAQVVGVVQFSDYPPEARRVPQVGSYTGFDLEAVLALAPDLMVGWSSGNPPNPLQQLEALGLPVYRSEPRHLGDIADDIERLGVLAGTEAVAQPAAAAFRARLATLRARYAGRRPVRVFYQVWNQPLYTLNGEHLISELLAACGGVNVFAALPALAAQVNVEAVLAADPEAIIAAGMAEANVDWLDAWRRWPQLAAAARGNLFLVHPDLLNRHGPRVLDGMEQICTALDTARSRGDAPR
ncbi:iron complex transport system substrate-binding protein [Plasticicumulans lactativorans]|uniref:Iron complex transport system substrate-binding protein n=1 Tax=Plasticicumulans lactativorans TaxID=1133106 RepID=A0A4R2KS31_9GAMM|nr:cobalamin-binding protein [Plasticicumulans lactativorans]TCO76534.1 iron complex transport system substrate-binding protein [Plasticicumulans lactativorans]